MLSRQLSPAAVALTLSLSWLASVPSHATPPPAPDARELLKRYDEVMSPAVYEADARMTAHREDGTTRSYTMRIMKSGTEKMRSLFLEPASAKGQEMLRNGDNLWLYMPNLKRAVRVASRDQFMGGDFNNADVLRVHYDADYTATLGKSDKPGEVLLELKAKGQQVAYDAIKLWMNVEKGAKEAQPVRGEFYAASGKLLRSAKFEEVKPLGEGWVRPTKIVMKNELQPARWSEMVWDSGKVKQEISSQRFVVDDLGR